MSFGEKIQNDNHANNSSLRAPTSGDCIALCYTSGTTGNPKGVKVSHKMVLAHVLAFQTRISKSGRMLDEQDTHLSFLPLAHIFELDNMSMSILYGIKVGFYSGDVANILDDMRVLKPTVLAIVPRILNKIYADI